MADNDLPNQEATPPQPDANEILKAFRRLEEEVGKIKENLPQTAPIDNKAAELEDLRRQIRLAKARRDLHEAKKPLLERPKWTLLILILLALIFLGVIVPPVISVCSNPDQKKVNEGYESLGELVIYIKNLEDKNKRDDRQDSRIQALSDRIDRLKPIDNNPQKVEVTVKNAQSELQKSQPVPSKKAIGVINIDASTH